MNIEDQVRRLVERVRELEDRVDELENPELDQMPSAIGYELPEEEEFDEDASEY